MSCNVCLDGKYPIHNNMGEQLYWITCPECGGSGLTEEEDAFEARRRSDVAKYQAAMDEMREHRANAPQPSENSQ